MWEGEGRVGTCALAQRKTKGMFEKLSACSIVLERLWGLLLWPEVGSIRVDFWPPITKSVGNGTVDDFAEDPLDRVSIGVEGFFFLVFIIPL